METATIERRNLAGKYLTFNLGSECYGIPVLRIREIIRFTTITAVPQMPAFVKGVINLRGKIIPVTDMRVKFGLAPEDITERSCIVVVQLSGAIMNNSQMGLIVDAVEEVLNVTQADVEDTPDFGVQQDIHSLLGMAKIKGKVITLLDLDSVLARTA
ncbi:MAG TPA: chemotaxis protein CheW [Verrucomicrobiae bacterium]|nr:chemotaxis protein CheW [Verrucomicrobiae bacterium]